ncbi:MAG: hypothetical protein V3T84_03245 [Phycisphaerales bacterium]
MAKKKASKKMVRTKANKLAQPQSSDQPVSVRPELKGVVPFDPDTRLPRVSLDEFKTPPPFRLAGGKLKVPREARNVPKNKEKIGPGVETGSLPAPVQRNVTIELEDFILPLLGGRASSIDERQD